MKKSLQVFLVLYLTLCVLSCKKNSDTSVSNDGPSQTTVTYSGNLVKSNDSVITSATGTVTGVFNPGNNELAYTFTWHRLTGKAMEMHIHDGGSIIIPIQGFPMDTSGTWSGKATLTATQVTDLQAGRLYGQIHTLQYPAGEVLGVLTTGSQGGNGNTNPPPYNPY